MAVRQIIPTLPLFIDQVAIGVNPNSSISALALAQAWVDVSYRAQVVSAITQGRQYELDRQQAASGMITLRNDDEAFAPSNTASPYTGNVKPYRPYRSLAMYPIAGNILSPSNPSPEGSFAAYDPSFETAATAAAQFTQVSGPTLASSTAQHFDGSRSVLVTWAAGAAHSEYLAMPVGPCAVGFDYCASIYVWVVAGTAVQAFDHTTGTYGTSTAGTGSWQRVNVTFTATANVHYIGLTNAGTAAAGNSCYVDAIQFELVQPGSTFPTAWSGTAGPVFYQDFVGYIERWPETWQYQGYFGTMQSPLVDAFTMLARVTLNDIATNEVMVDVPDAYYPCSEDASVGACADITGTYLPAQIYSLPSGVIGQPSPTVAIGDSTSCTYESFPSLLYTATGSVANIQGSFLQLDPACVLANGPWTVEGCFIFDETQSGSTIPLDQTSAISDPGSYYLRGVQVVLSVTPGAATSTFQATIGQIAWVRGAVLPSVTVGGSVAALAPNIPHHWALTWAADNKTAQLYLDGVLIDTEVCATTISATVGPVPSIGYKTNLGTITTGMTANLGRVAIWRSKVVSGTRIAAHAQAAITAFAGELSGTRYARLLSYGPQFLVTHIDAGMTAMGPATGLGTPTSVDGGQTLFDALGDVADAEGGDHYIDRDGSLNFSGRAHRYTTHTPMWVFGENAAGGEFPYQDDLEADYDTQVVYNEVTSQGTSGVVFTFTDPTSIQEYFESSNDASPNVLWDSEARDIGSWLLQQYKEPSQRIPVVTIDASKQQAGNLWAVALQVSQCDLVTVKRRTPTFTLSINFWVDQIIRNRNPGSYQVAMLLTPLWNTTVWQLGDPTYGVLGSTTVLAR